MLRDAGMWKRAFPMTLRKLHARNTLHKQDEYPRNKFLLRSKLVPVPIFWPHRSCLAVRCCSDLLASSKLYEPAAMDLVRVLTRYRHIFIRIAGNLHNAGVLHSESVRRGGSASTSRSDPRERWWMQEVLQWVLPYKKKDSRDKACTMASFDSEKHSAAAGEHPTTLALHPDTCCL